MAFTSIHDIAVSWNRYERSLAGLSSPAPDGLALQLAGPTEEGVRVVGIWTSEPAFERFQRALLQPAIASLGEPVSIQWTVRRLQVCHLVLGMPLPMPNQEQQPC